MEKRENGPWPCKCNNCGAKFVYQATDHWLDKGGPVLCQKCK